MLKKVVVALFVSKFLLLSYLCSSLNSCANVVAPLGGDRDSVPPSLIQEESTPNFQTNFEKQVIELTFDEWVVLEDAFNQVIVSPPLEQRPELKLRRKTVRIEFDENEVLRPDATYTINLGEAVKDLNEKNPAENLRFVFSTGDVLDSLRVIGKVYDVLTNKPVEDVWFMMYENLADSVVRTEPPFYLTKTDKEGRCLIENVRADTFKVVALKSADADYFFNQQNEQIAFPDTPYVVSLTNIDTIFLPLFTEVPRLTLTGNEKGTFGLVKLIFNRPPDDSITVTHTGSGFEFIRETDKDTLKLWYPEEQERPWRILVRPDTAAADTIHMEALSKAEFVAGSSFTCEQAGTKIGHNPTLPFQLEFNHPVGSWDTSLLRIYEDTLRTVVQPAISRDSANSRLLRLNFNWREGIPYSLEFLPGAVQDVFGLVSDSVFIDLNVREVKDFGNINLSVSALDTNFHYLIELLGTGERVVRKFLVEGESNFSERVTTIAPGKYRLRIVEDGNRNGVWDTGHYDLHRQPEKQTVEDIEQLRANWDVEFTTTWKPPK